MGSQRVWLSDFHFHFQTEAQRVAKARLCTKKPPSPNSGAGAPPGLLSLHIASFPSRGRDALEPGSAARLSLERDPSSHRSSPACSPTWLLRRPWRVNANSPPVTHFFLALWYGSVQSRPWDCACAPQATGRRCGMGAVWTLSSGVQALLLNIVLWCTGPTSIFRREIKKVTVWVSCTLLVWGQGREGNTELGNVCAQSAYSCPTLCDPMDCSAPRLLCPWDSPGKNTGAGCQFLLQGIFPTQGWSRLSCVSRIGRCILYH